MKKVNLIIVLLLGSAIAVSSTATVKGALAMAIATALVLVITSALNKVLKTDSVYVSVILTTVVAGVVDMLLNAYLPGLYELSGMYISLLGVNMLTYATGKKSVSDAALTAVLFAAVLVGVGAVRELFGTGCLFGNQIISGFNNAILTQEAGGLMIYAFAAAIVNKITPEASQCICCGLGIKKEGE